MPAVGVQSAKLESTAQPESTAPAVGAESADAQSEPDALAVGAQSDELESTAQPEPAAPMLFRTPDGEVSINQRFAI